MTIRRVNHGRYHTYVDTDTGEKIPGVTKITGDGLPKQALINWAAETTAGYAIDHWDELSDKPPSERLKILTGSRYAVSDPAANRGRQVHKLAERLVAGDQVKVPEGLEGYVRSYVRFLDEFDVRPVLVEATVVNREHRYCGTLDLIADLLDPQDPEPDPDLAARLSCLLDLKTSRSGVFGETALQLAGYRFAEAVVAADGSESPLPEVQFTGAVHIRPDGYDLVPVTAEFDQFRQFLYAQQIARFVADGRELIGEPIPPPHTSTWTLVRS